MKVILKEYVYKHGVAGDVVNVANGFARNFLIPRGLAVKATPRALAENENLLTQVTVRRNELNEQLVAVAEKLNGVELVFGRKAGSNGKLYGSVTTMDIADALLEKTGLDINRRRISERPLREIGTFDVPVRMGGDLAPELRVIIVREEDLAAYLAAESGEEEAVAEAAAETAEIDETADDYAVALDELAENAALVEEEATAEEISEEAETGASSEDAQSEAEAADEAEEAAEDDEAASEDDES